MTNKKEDKKLDYKIIKRDEKNRVVNMEIEIDEESIKAERESAIKELGKNIEIKGFRKGTAPLKMVESEIGEFKIFEESVFQTVNKILPEIIINEKIDVVTQPKISIVKMALNNPLVFKAEFILMPTIELPDYKKIAKEIKLDTNVAVTDEEYNNYVEYLKKAKSSEKISHEHKCDDEKCEHKIDLPEFDDEFVKGLGDFKNVDEFKKYFMENMAREKEQKARQKRRVDILEKIADEAKIEMSDIFVDEELERMLSQFKSDIASMQLDYNEYLKTVKKTEEELRADWRTDATKRTRMNFIIPRIAIAENLEINNDELEKQMSEIKNKYPDIKESDAKIYFTQILTNEAVLKFLEEIK